MNLHDEILDIESDCVCDDYKAGFNDALMQAAQISLKYMREIEKLKQELEQARRLIK